MVLISKQLTVIVYVCLAYASSDCEILNFWPYTLMLGVWLRSDKYQIVVFGLTLGDHDNHYTTEVDHKTIKKTKKTAIEPQSISILSKSLVIVTVLSRDAKYTVTGCN